MEKFLYVFRGGEGDEAPSLEQMQAIMVKWVLGWVR